MNSQVEVIENGLLPQARGLVERLSLRLARYAPDAVQQSRVSLVGPSTVICTVLPVCNVMRHLFRSIRSFTDDATSFWSAILFNRLNLFSQFCFALLLVQRIVFW